LFHPRQPLFPATALVLAVAPAHASELVLTVPAEALAPGAATTLMARLDGVAEQPAFTFTLRGRDGAQLCPEASGRCTFWAPAFVPEPRASAVRVSWTDPATGLPASRDLVIQVRRGWSDLHQVAAFVPHLPGSTLEGKWLMADRVTGRIHLCGCDGSVWELPAPGGQAPFQDPCAIAVRPIQAGEEHRWEALVVDRAAHALLRLDADGKLGPVAGVRGQSGHFDGKAEAALFRNPTGAAHLPDGGILVCDSGNRCIRWLHDGVVETLAGCPGLEGWVDGPGDQASFVAPVGLAVDPATGRAYTCDVHGVRSVDRDGTVGTLAGGLEPGFEDWTADPPQDQRPDRMKGMPCLDRPTAVSWQDGLLRIVDAGNQAVRLLQVAGAGPDLGALATFPVDGRERVPAESETKLERKQPLAAAAPAAEDPLPLDHGNRFQILGARPRSLGQDEAGPAAELRLHQHKAVPMPDGSIMVWQPAVACPQCPGKPPRYCRHLHHRKLIHLFPERPGSRDWRYQVLPCQDKNWNPEVCYGLAAAGADRLTFGDATGYHRLQLTGGNGSRAIQAAEGVLILGPQKQRWYRLGLPFHDAGSGNCSYGPDGSIALAFPGRVALMKKDTINEVLWLQGKASSAQEARQARTAAKAKAPTVGFDPDGTLFLLDYETREIHAYPPGAERGTRILGPGAFPATDPGGNLAGFRGALFLAGRDPQDPSLSRVYRVATGGGSGHLQPTGLTLQADQSFFVTPQGDVLVAGEDGMSWLPSRSQPLERKVPAPEAAGDGAARAEAARALLAAETKRADEVYAALQRRLDREAQARAAKAESKSQGEAVAQPGEDPDLDGWDASDSEEEPEPADGKKPSAHGAAGHAPLAGQVPPGPEADGEGWTLVGSAAPGRAPAAAPVRRSRQGPRLDPIRGGATGRLDQLKAYAGGRFADDFLLMLKGHDFKVGFNNHDYNATSLCRERMDRFFRGEFAAEAPKGQVSCFGIGNKSVLRIAQWLLNNAGLANTAEELEAWNAAGRPARPRFRIGLYVQEGSRKPGQNGRIILELRDVRDYLKGAHPAGPQAEEGRRRTLEELEAAGFRTGLSSGPGRGPVATRGLRLILHEQINGVATCYPCAELDPP